jgi:predicted HicB family RNase H-like nuclease
MAARSTTKTDLYTYRITWSEEDKEYAGLCAEFPSLSWMAKTQEAALQGIRKLVADVVKDMQSNKEAVPLPFAIRHFSGKIMVRVPPMVHRNIAIQAAESKVSINRIINAKLSA